MNPLLARLAHLRDRIDGLSLRERALIMVSALVLLWALWDNLLMQPLNRHHHHQQERIQTLQGQVETLQQLGAQIVARAGQDPNTELREQVARIRGSVAELDKRLRDMTAELVDPKDMAPMLEAVLQRNRDLRLLQLRSLKPQSLLVGDKSAGESEAATIYRHPVEIVFEGRYLEVLGYLSSLESLPWELFWDSIHIELVDYPRSRITLMVHTLGLREGLLGV